MLLKGNLHTHTTLSDGQLTPDEVLGAYRSLGYDFLAFTDHRCFLGPGGETGYWQRLPESEDIVVLRGVEEEPAELGGRHVGVIQAGDEELRIINHPNEYGLSVEEVLESVRVVDAHAVEVTCHGRYLERYDTAEIHVPKIATDDAHHAREIGVAWIEVEATRAPAAILRAIKHGDFERYVAGQRL